MMGVSFSNTWDLYLLGWNGCCVEQAKVECKVLCIEYNRNLEMLEEFRNYCKDYNMNEIHRNDDNVIFALNGNQ